MTLLAMLLTLAMPIQQEEEIQALIGQLGDTSSAVRKKAQNKLLTIGAKAIPHLEKTEASSSDPIIKERCRKLIITISHIAFKHQIQTLIDQLGDKSFPVRKKAQKKLLAIGGKAVPYLEKWAASSTDAEIKTQCHQLIAAVFKECIPANPVELPSITKLPLDEFVRIGEHYRKKAEAIQKKQLSFWNSLDNVLIIRLYLEDKVRNGASKQDIQRLIKVLKDRPQLLPPLSKHIDFPKVKSLVPKTNPPWYYYNSWPPKGSK
jgi:hypothetical protein